MSSWPVLRRKGTTSVTLTIVTTTVVTWTTINFMSLLLGRESNIFHLFYENNRFHSFVRERERDGERERKRREWRNGVQLVLTSTRARITPFMRPEYRSHGLVPEAINLSCSISSSPTLTSFRPLLDMFLICQVGLDTYTPWLGCVLFKLFWNYTTYT